MLQNWFRRASDPAAVAPLYARIVAQARQTGFYRDCGVPDSLDGRFDLLVLHVFLVMHRLKGGGAEAGAAAQHLLEHMVTDLDRSVREMGVADLGVGRRITAMANAINGRLHTYDRALAADDDLPLQVALDNNLYGTVHDTAAGDLDAMAGYVRAAAALLNDQPLARLLAGDPAFPAAPQRRIDHAHA
ncbi:MAG: ubiquinol-cytochrome C chaperone [Azospirillum sp.]|nr:ubiquinol-cytochrome C chaperone [Azospirillum sp.]